MKITLILAMAFVASAFTTATDKQVDVTNSQVTWKGHKVTGHHEGTIKLQNGSLNFDDKNHLTGGSFTMDMATLAVTDLDGDMQGKLEGHLKSDDFFGIENHPKATFVITNVEGKDGIYNVTGNLTIKGISHPNTFKMVIKDNNSAMAALKVDRTKYDIKYRSASFFDGLKDKAIYDEFDLNVNLKF